MNDSLQAILASYQANGVTLDMLRAQQQRKDQQHSSLDYPHSITSWGLNYLEKLKKPLSKSTTGPLSIEQSKIGFEVAKRVCWQIILEKLGGDAANFSTEGNVTEVLPQLIRYFIGDSQSIYPTHKGIYLWGDTGVGKTFIMETLQEMVKRLGLNQQAFKIHNTQTIAENVLVNEKFDPSVYVSNSAVFDDFGQEEPLVKLYNNDIKPMAMIVNRVYDNFKQQQGVTHFTSMLPPQLLLEKTTKGMPQIDRRAYERICEMTTIVKLKGKSKRNIPQTVQY